MSTPSLGGLLATRQGSMLLALLCAVVAAGVLIFALGRFKAGVKQPVAQATVLIATREIPKGTPGDVLAASGYYKATPVLADQVSATALGNASAIAGQVARATILPGQQLTSGEFSPLSGVDEAIKPGYRAVEINIGEAPGAIDITQAGSRVDIYATGATSNVATATANSSGSSTTVQTGGSQATDGAGSGGPIVSDVEILKPATAAPVSIGGTTVSGSTLVLELPVADVSEVIDQNGALYLALRPADNSTAAAPDTTDHGAN